MPYPDAGPRDGRPRDGGPRDGGPRDGGRSTGTTVVAPAKINLGLSVGAARADGFHELTTLFHAVRLFDEVTATELGHDGRGIELRLDGAESAGLTAGPDNLAWRAAVALADWAGRPTNVALHLTKQIPIAAGLAGGSADAAATLLACTRLWQLEPEPAELDRLAARLGSDVAFALHGGSALGTGRGERLADLPVGPELHWVLAVSNGQLSTPAVYAELDRQRAAGLVAPASGPNRPDLAELTAALTRGDLSGIAARMANDLQPAALALAPYLHETLTAGRRLGALAGIVSGSGPTCVFLVPDADTAEHLAQALTADPSCRYARAVAGAASGAQVRQAARAS